MKKIFIVGGGGFARECHLALEVLIKHKPELGLSFGGFLGHNGNVVDTKSLQHLFLGDVKDHVFKDGEYCVIGVGRPDIRKKIFDDLKAMGAKFYTLIAYDCLIGETVKFGEANIIFSSSFTSEITAGDGNLFNGEVIVGHDCKIGNFNFFAPRTNILGNVKIGDGNTIGTGSVLLPNCKIGDNNKIAPLSAVYRGCKNDCHMLGNPAMKI